jgi:hypothetical protein
MLPSQHPPRDLAPTAVPMFVGLGWDDNKFSGLSGSGGSGGLSWALSMARRRKNPAGSGSAATFDGSPVHMSFYLTSGFAKGAGPEDARFVRAAWQEARDDGHELGNHSVSHPHGLRFDQEAWQHEIASCTRDLQSLGLVDARAEAALGFRTPYLEYNDDTLAVVSRLGFLYDCSIEEGFQPDHDGTNYLWPYTLEQGSPGHDAQVTAGGQVTPLTPRAGLWEMPAYAVVVPPDDACAHYGIAPGLRAKLALRQSYFSVDDGKITGLDWNMWVAFGMSRAEFVATLSYTLDLRLRGNRAPFLFGGHTDYYSSKYTEIPGTSVSERQAAMEDFLDYALSKPEVRIVSTRQILAWIRQQIA